MEPEYIGDNLVKITTDEFFTLYAIYQAYVAHKRKKDYCRAYYESRKHRKPAISIQKGNIKVDF